MLIIARSKHVFSQNDGDPESDTSSDLLLLVVVVVVVSNESVVVDALSGTENSTITFKHCVSSETLYVITFRFHLLVVISVSRWSKPALGELAAGKLGAGQLAAGNWQRGQLAAGSNGSG